MNPLNLIKANPLFMGAIGVIILALGIYIGALNLMLGSAKGEVASLKGERARLVGITWQWKAAHDALAIKTAECNASVDDLAKRSEKAKRASAEAIKKAEAGSAYLRRVIEAVNARERAGQPMTCSEAVAAAKNDLAGVNQ